MMSLATLRRAAVGLAAASLLGAGLMGAASAPADPDAPRYDADGRLVLPADYREWVFLSSGLDMSYNPTPSEVSAHVFNNVFVPRAAYAAFRKTGHWPDHTVMMLENRGGASSLSINTRGQVQTGEIRGLEVHVRDEARFKGGWGFFAFSGDGAPAKQIPYAADCYSCHEAHAAVDTTFVQFYPTLMPVAKKLGTLSKGFLDDEK